MNEDTRDDGRDAGKSGAHSGFVGAGSQFTGSLNAPGPFNVNGGFHGEIESADLVSVGAKGVFEGNISAREVVVESGGRVVGEIDAERVEVQGGGVIAGVSVRAARLVLAADSDADGARFEIRHGHKRRPRKDAGRKTGGNGGGARGSSGGQGPAAGRPTAAAGRPAGGAAPAGRTSAGKTPARNGKAG